MFRSTIDEQLLWALRPTEMSTINDPYSQVILDTVVGSKRDRPADALPINRQIRRLWVQYGEKYVQLVSTAAPAACAVTGCLCYH